MNGTTRYGRFYWCAKVSKDLSKDGEIYLMADDVQVVEGSLRFLQRREESGTVVEHVNLLIPPGKWLAVYAASVIDGAAVAVDHWKGEIAEVNETEEEGEPPSRAGPRKKGGRKITKTLRYAILERDGFRCQACGRERGDGVILEVDHKTPDSLWGDATPENLQTLCRDCNRGKGNRGGGAV